MAAVSTIAIAIGALAAAAGTAYTIDSSEKQKIAAQDAQNKQNYNARVTDRNLKQQQNQNELLKQRDLAISRQRATRGITGGRSSTILTGPLGATTPGSTIAGAKKILGA